MTIPVHDQITSSPREKGNGQRRRSSLLATFAALIYALLCIGSHQQLRAQCGEPPRDVCQDSCCLVDALLLNTGYDHTRGGIYDGEKDGYWTITRVDNDEYNAAHPLPTSPYIVRDVAEFGEPLTNSQWINLFPNPHDNIPGDVTYEKCFCVCGSQSELTFNLDVLAPTGASVYFDGEFIAATDASMFPRPTPISFTRTVTAGRHCVEVVVSSDGRKSPGVDIRGTVQGAGLLKYTCCPGPGIQDPDACQTNHLTLGSDDSWTMVSGPSDSVTYPHCATIITNYPYWHTPTGGSNWIGRNSGGTSRGLCVAGDHYVYRKSFCVHRAGTFVITVTSMADDSGVINLNGVNLGNTGGYLSPRTRTFIVALQEGCNCFEFDVFDLGCLVTGLDALIDIQGGSLMRPECCDCGLCTAGRGAARHNDNDAPSAVPSNPAGSLAARPMLISIPNPATGEATVHYVIDKDAEAQVEIYNTAGKLIMVVDQGMRKTGEHAVPVITKGLPKGAYRLQLKYGANSLSIPLNVE